MIIYQYYLQSLYKILFSSCKIKLLCLCSYIMLQITLGFCMHQVYIPFLCHILMFLSYFLDCKLLKTLLSIILKVGSVIFITLPSGFIYLLYYVCVCVCVFQMWKHFPCTVWYNTNYGFTSLDRSGLNKFTHCN
jgi:hypothetical protein